MKTIIPGDEPSFEVALEEGSGYVLVSMEIQKYLADMRTREELAQAIQNYWANVTPVQR